MCKRNNEIRPIHVFVQFYKRKHRKDKPKTNQIGDLRDMRGKGVEGWLTQTDIPLSIWFGIVFTFRTMVMFYIKTMFYINKK